MKNLLEYKGYHTKIEFDTESLVLYGKIEGINDLVNFESNNINDIEMEFHNAVDDYLEFCNEVGKDPDKEYKGTFNVRISPTLHKELSLRASKNGISLNAAVERAIKEYLTGYSETNIQLSNSIKILSNVLETQMVFNSYKMPLEKESKIFNFTAPNVTMSYQKGRLS